MAALIRRLLRGRRGEDGAELIELAIVLPILFMVVAAIIDFGFLFQRYEAVTNAVREGARIAVLPGYTTADVQSRINSYLAASGMSSAPTPPTVVYSTSPPLPSGSTISVVTVTLDYPVPLSYLGPIASLVGGSQPGSITVRAVSVMRTETAMGGS